VIEDLPDRYDEYLERFERELPGISIGEFAKFAGKLIKKLTFEEFTPQYLEYIEIWERYEDSVERGDTVNDVVLKLLRERAANLLLEPPA